MGTECSERAVIVLSSCVMCRPQNVWFCKEFRDKISWRVSRGKWDGEMFWLMILGLLNLEREKHKNCLQKF